MKFVTVVCVGDVFSSMLTNPSIHHHPYTHLLFIGLPLWIILWTILTIMITVLMSLLQYWTDHVPAYIPPPPSQNPPRVDEYRPYKQRKQPDSQQPRVPFRQLEMIFWVSAEIPTSHLLNLGQVQRFAMFLQRQLTERQAHAQRWQSILAFFCTLAALNKGYADCDRWTDRTLPLKPWYTAFYQHMHKPLYSTILCDQQD